MTDKIKVESNVTNLELYSDNYPFSLSLRIKNFDSETSYKKFIRNCESMIRRCQEYSLWRQYIIDVLQINSCMITNETMDEVTIEVHHHLPSLYTLVSALVNKKLDTGEEFCTFDIAREAIELHFLNKVGYITLLKSMHEKFHNGNLTIPISLIKGDYKSFIDSHSRYLDDIELEKITDLLAINETNCTWSRDNYPIAAEGGL